MSMLCHHVLIEIKRFKQDFIPISILSSFSFFEEFDLDHIDPSFMYIKLLKDIFIDMKFEKEDRKVFIDYYRKSFPLTDTTKEMINQIENYDNRKTIIRQYTSPSSLYEILNQAIRHINIEVLILMGFFIHDFCWELEELYSESRIINQEKIIVYRGQKLPNSEWNRVTTGSLFCFNSFLSTSFDRSIANFFAETVKFVVDHTAIVFEIHIDPSFGIHRFASIEDISAFPEEREVLFSMQSIFRVDNIDSMSDGIQYVRLSLTDDDDPALRELMEYIRRQLNGPTPMHRLGQLLINLKEWSKAKHIYETILKKDNKNNKSEMADLHHQLGCINDELKSPEEAMYHYQQVFNFDSNLLENERYRLSPTYASIARLLYRSNKLDEAFNYYNKAVQLALTASNIDKIKLGSYYNNMAIILRDNYCYNEALFMFEKVLSSQLEGGLPLTHPDIVVTYSNIGTVYEDQKNYEKAFEYFEKCFNIELHSLPLDDPSIVDSHIAMDETLQKLRRVEEAIKHVKHAFQINKNMDQKIDYQQYIDELQLML